MHAYYLDQMGIERWIRRPVSVSDHAVILLVINKAETAPVEGKARVLFNHMIQCVGLDASQVHFTTEPFWTMACERYNPRALWAMDCDLRQHVSALNRPVVLSQNLHDLLLNPIDKKYVYSQLLQIIQSP